MSTHAFNLRSNKPINQKFGAGLFCRSWIQQIIRSWSHQRYSRLRTSAINQSINSYSVSLFKKWMFERWQFKKALYEFLYAKTADMKNNVSDFILCPTSILTVFANDPPYVSNNILYHILKLAIRREYCFKNFSLYSVFKEFRK